MSEDFTWEYKRWPPQQRVVSYEELTAMLARGDDPNALPFWPQRGTYFLRNEGEQEELHINADQTKERDEQMQTIVDMLNKFRDDPAIRR